MANRVERRAWNELQLKQKSEQQANLQSFLAMISERANERTRGSQLIELGGKVELESQAWLEK